MATKQKNIRLEAETLKSLEELEEYYRGKFDHTTNEEVYSHLIRDLRRSLRDGDFAPDTQGYVKNIELSVDAVLENVRALCAVYTEYQQGEQSRIQATKDEMQQAYEDLYRRMQEEKQQVRALKNENKELTEKNQALERENSELRGQLKSREDMEGLIEQMKAFVRKDAPETEEEEDEIIKNQMRMQDLEKKTKKKTKK